MLTAQSFSAAKRLTILSSCCGVTGEAVLTDSAVILLYAAALCAGDAFALLTTAILPLLNGVLILPMAGLVRFCGCRNLVLFSNFPALAGYIMAVCAGFFPGQAAAAMLVSGIMLFAVCQTGFVSGWLPFLDLFLPAEERTGFLGRMRFRHQLAAIGFLGAVTLLIGKNPRTEVLQLVLAAGALSFAGRIWFLSRVRCGGMREPEYPDWFRGLKMALSNREVMKFSLYTVILNIGSGAVIPLTLLYLKHQRHLSDNLLVGISILVFSGMMTGYILVAKMEARFGRYGAFAILHALILVSILGIVFTGDGACGIFGTALFLMLCSGCTAATSVIAGAEIMRRASADNKMMAMALWGAFFYGGNGISRLAAGAFSSTGAATHPYTLFIAGAVTGLGLLFLAAAGVRSPDSTGGLRPLKKTEWHLYLFEDKLR